MHNAGISVAIPSARANSNVYNNLCSVADALKTFEGPSEMIIMADRKIQSDDFLKELSQKYNFIKIYENPVRQGSAYARLAALRKTSNDVILFTDDDCIVPFDWACRMHAAVLTSGVVTGNLTALHDSTVSSQVDAYIDQLRMQSVDAAGNAKYLSFPNCGVLRNLLPEDPFSPDRYNTTEDIDLGCRLKLRSVNIRFDPSITVKTEYPQSLSELLKRKVKHAKGIAYLRARLGKAHCAQLELAETPWQMFARWMNMTIKSPLHPLQKTYLTFANTAYCSALAYYDRAFRHIEMEIP